MGKLKTWQEQLQEMVDNGISAAEEAQKSLAAKPFDYAEKFEADVREYSVKSLRKRYSDLSSALFERLRAVNNRLGGYAGDLVAKLEKETAEQADTVSEAAEEAGEEVARTAQSAKKAVAGKTSGSTATAKTSKSASTAKSSAAKSQTSEAKSEGESNSTSA